MSSGVPGITLESTPETTIQPVCLAIACLDHHHVMSGHGSSTHYADDLHDPADHRNNWEQILLTDPRYPKIQIWKEFLPKQVVEGLGYVPGVCWSFLREVDVYDMKIYGKDSFHIYNTIILENCQSWKSQQNCRMMFFQEEHGSSAVHLSKCRLHQSCFSEWSFPKNQTDLIKIKITLLSHRPMSL